MYGGLMTRVSFTGIERGEKLRSYKGTGEKKDSFSAIQVSKFNDDIPGHRVISTAELAKAVNWNELLTIP
jgi:hypothetical protein